MYIVAPIKTEKAIGKIEFANTITFRVLENANKNAIKEEVEKLFGVKVAKIHIYNSLKGGKRALVTLTKEFKSSDIAAKLKIV